MTDREMLIALFNRCGVRWTEDADYDREDFPQAATAIRVTSDFLGGANDGYSCFYTTYVFDAAGCLLSVGAWE